MTTPRLPTISVVFPTYNRCDVVEETLVHLVAQDYPAELVEILVCDNSTDGTPAMVARVAASAPQRIRLLSSDERLPAVKRNQGLREATGELVLFLNDDVWLRPDALRVHASAHQGFGAPVAVLGHVEQSRRMPTTPFVEWYRPFAYDEIVDAGGTLVDYRYFWSMNLSLPRRTMLDRQLLFHEDWANIGHEDVELGYRWARAGYGILYRPDASGEHYHPHDLDSACRLQYSVGRGLHDLRALVPDPDLLARYGVAALARGRREAARRLARRALFNRLTVPVLQRHFGRLEHRSRVAEWSYWKILLFHADRGWRDQAPRRPRPVTTVPEVAA